MKLPVRKCFHAAKVGFFVILVVTILALFEQWRGGKRSARAQSSDLEDAYEREILEDEARIIPGLGEGGVAAHLTGEAKRLGEESEKKLAINVYLSDRIAYNRTLKDQRNPACQRVVYDAELPSASVILIFHNEPYSVVVRTIWSVINSARRSQPWYRQANYVDRETGRTMTLGYPGQDPASPFVYLKEIILVDDNSTLPELKGKLSHYVRTRLPPDLIRILRLPDRVGVTRSRFEGSRIASGDVMVFLDSQCEANIDWLRPLLQRIKEKRTAVLTPIIDLIEQGDLEFYVGDKVKFETTFLSVLREQLIWLDHNNAPNGKGQGLILARIAGARLARGAVLVFLDAHCEPAADWLRPLLQRVAHKRDAVVTPLIDVIDQTTFRLDAAQQFQVGGFTFMGHFTWVDVPEREKKRRGSDIAPTWSPTMAGGLFAISRAYYWEIGAYDEQMAGWGGENLEMSFRVWQCGGTLETIPCSRVGHVFRSFHPYGLPANSDTHGINTARMAEVWMDEYAELFYLHRPDLRKSPKIGDVTHRRVLREKLQCKSFQWYLDNVYREKFVPVRDVYGFGRFMNPASGLCLDTLQREGEASPLGVYGCHARLEATQYLALSLRGELRDEEKCAEVQYKRRGAGEVGEDVSRRVLMVTCHGKQRGQRWRYLPTQQLQHVESGLCLSVTAAAGSDATVAKCRATPRQLWKIDYSEMNDFGMKNAIEPSEQQLRLQKLRGNRRISRSLLSYPEEERNKTRRHHHKSKKSKKHKHKSKKNKFILKLIRAVNNTEEHLEADVYCRHKQLFPNNSFVRDLVTLLNDKDIKVINNGRVFEHNRVSALARPAPEPAAAASASAAPPPRRPPLEPKSQKKRKQKKTSHLIEPLNFLSNANAIDRIDRIDKSNAIDKPDAIDAIDRTDATEEPVQKKIIIEDFVEVKPGAVTTQRAAKRRERVRPPQPAPPPHRAAAAAGADEREEPARAAEGSSPEDAPLLSEERRAPDRSGEAWPAVESRFRRNKTRAYALARSRTRAPLQRRHSAVPVFAQAQDPDNSLPDHRSGDEAPAPVKVVMRSNLTFNLGDEFFRWRQRTADDVANLLGELVIPANTATHKQTSAETDDTNTQTHTRHRGDAQPHKHHTDNTQTQTHYTDDRTQPDTDDTRTHKHHTDNTQYTDDRTQQDTDDTRTHKHHTDNTHYTDDRTQPETENTKPQKTDRDADVDEKETEYRQESDKENELHRQSEREFRNTEQSRKEFSNREERDKDDLLTGRGRSRIVPDESSSSESGDD